MSRHLLLLPSLLISLVEEAYLDNRTTMETPFLMAEDKLVVDLLTPNFVAMTVIMLVSTQILVAMPNDHLTLLQTLLKLLMLIAISMNLLLIGT